MSNRPNSIVSTASAFTYSMIALIFVIGMVWSHSVRSQDMTACRPVEEHLAYLSQMGASVMNANSMMARAKAVYAATPPVGEEPVADRLLLANLPDGGTVILFVNNDKVCDFLRARGYEGSAALLRQLQGDPA